MYEWWMRTKRRGVQLRREALQRSSDTMLASRDVQNHVVAGPPDPVDIIHVDEPDPAARTHRDPLDLGSDRAQQFLDPLIETLGVRRRLRRRSDPLERLTKPSSGEGLQKVVERPGFERLDGMTIVGRHEHHRRHLIRTHRPQDLEPVHLRHLNIEEQHIRAVTKNRFDRRGTVLTLGHQLNVSLVA